MSQISVLLVEDDQAQRELIHSILLSEEMNVASASSVEEAILLLKQRTFDLVFSDWKLGELSGLDLLNYVRKNHPQLGFAIATAYGTISHAVEAMEAGADDYLSKPFPRQALLLCIEKVRKAAALRTKNTRLTEQLGEQQQLVDLIGRSSKMQSVYERIQRVSSTHVTVLITGESGTGKELAARALHQLSSRNQNSFIAINCGAIPDSLAEAELFGAEKGAYTGADTKKVGKLQAADGGTVFLDEIGELPLILQAKILRFLQEGTITPLGSHEEIKLDVRVIAATHRDLNDMVKKGEFREDLYYRLNIVPIEMPPLRERLDDLWQLIDFFIEVFSKRYGVEKQRLSKQTMKQMMEYHWPGNVRELSNRLERFLLLGDEKELVAELATPQSHSADLISGFVMPSEGMDWEAFEQQCLKQALDLNQGNRTKAAKFLKLSYKTFLYRLEKYNIHM
ncbi:sigma-54-dependent Fis family transcriptional regulator [Alteromonadaceae bacterium M269]|nr:sigma-54-dependent Fis family transcriptional regulator [Alteromonadaceae bacterium M269]